MSESESIRVGLMGLGTVGTHVAHTLLSGADNLLRRTGSAIQLTHVAEMDVPEDMKQELQDVELFHDATEMVEQADCDIMIELMGGMEPAYSVILRSLERGMDVVTANKELLAKRGASIYREAENSGQRIRFEASVGGSIPVIRTIREAMVASKFDAVYGIINGTANYVLTRMEEEKQLFKDALELAQEKGYAEADPSYDVEGDDSAHKIAILASLCFGSEVDLESVHCEGITRITPEIMEDARRLGYRIKLLGIAKRLEDGIDVRVHPTMIPEKTAMAAVQDEYNAVFVQADPIGSSMLYGKGAGGGPTSTAVISDVVSLAANHNRVRSPIYFEDRPLELVPIENITSRYYLRLRAVDKPGVLAQVTRILGDHQISIDTVLQQGRSAERAVPVILTTHRAREGDMQDAVEKISGLDVIEKTPVCLRIEKDLVHH